MLPAAWSSSALWLGAQANTHAAGTS